MKYLSNILELRKYIASYWIIHDVSSFLNDEGKLYAYPGITPDLIIPLKGHIEYESQGKKLSFNSCTMFNHLKDGLSFNSVAPKAFVIVQFKPMGVASVLPFTRKSAQSLMDNSICDAEIIFGKSIINLHKHLKVVPDEQIIESLDDWFLGCMNKKSSCFFMEMTSELGEVVDLTKIKALTNYSSSTLERYFKKETALTPKKYHSLNRYKKALEEIYLTQNKDWSYYIEKYGYYDQSHFIKEIKRYTHFTPSQLLQAPGFIKYRPLGDS